MLPGFSSRTCVFAFAVAGALLLSGVSANLDGLSLQQSAPTVTPQNPNAPAPTSTPAQRPSYAPPLLSVSAREVLLDVLATDADGHPVTGLTSADFKVVENGEPQTLRDVEEHHPMSATDLARLNAAPKLPPNTFTNYTPLVNTNASTVILLDAMDTPVTAQEYLRGQLIAYLKHMQPGASIAIFQLDTEMRLIQGFTSDQQALLAAAESKRDMPSLSRPIGGNAYMYHVGHLDILRAGMQMLGRYLAGFPGRKNLIWFTGNVPLWHNGTGFGDPFHDSFNVNPGDDLFDLTGVLTVSRVAVYPVDTRGLQSDPQFDASRGGAPGLRGSRRFFTRQAINEANLEDVASTTGGKAYYNTNDLKRVIAEVVSDGSSYYTLAYATTNKKWEGQFRSIKITVDRPDVHLQYRNGYYARNREAQEQRQISSLEQRMARAASQALPAQPTSTAPPDSSTPAQPPGPGAAGEPGAVIQHPKGGLEAAMALGAVPPTEIVFAASLAPEAQIVKIDKNDPMPPNNFLLADWQHKPFRDYQLLFYTDARNVQFTRTADGIRHGQVEFVAVVYDQQGRPVNSVARTAVLDLKPETWRTVLDTGLGIRGNIAIPIKGNYFLRFGVHDRASDRIGAFEIPVDRIQLGVAGAGLHP